MRFLVPVGGDVGEAYGIISAPNHRGVPAGIKNGLPWAADLGCLMGPDYVKKINFTRAHLWLKEMEEYRETCLFVAGADVVGDAVSTTEAYEEFSPYFTGWPLAYVAQNGAENLPIPDDCTAVFIGGTIIEGRYYRKAKGYSGKLIPLDWKESPEAMTVIKRAQQAGKHIHIGRVNWGRKYNLFNMIHGSELFTCDGTRTKKDGTEKAIRAWLDYEARPQPAIKL